MKKRILVSVDAGETRVAVLEGKGPPGGGAAAGRSRSKDSASRSSRGAATAT